MSNAPQWLRGEWLLLDVTDVGGSDDGGIIRIVSCTFSTCIHLQSFTKNMIIKS